MLALVALASIVLSALGLLGVAGVAHSVQDQATIKQCLQSVSVAVQNLQQKYGSLGNAPADDPNVTTIRACKSFADLTAATPGHSAATQNLNAAVSSALLALTTCTVSSVDPAQPKAGIDFTLHVTANVPLTGQSAAAGASLTGGVSLSEAMIPTSQNQLVWETNLSIPTNVDLSNQTTEVTVHGQSDIGRLSDGTCPAGADPNSPPGQCLISCTAPPFPIVWAPPPVPSIRLFLAAPSTVVKGAPTPVGLTWIVKDATDVSIDQGIGEVDNIGVDLEFPPDQTTTYTLTANGVRPQDTQTATAAVTVQAAPFVSLSAPTNQNTVTSPTVPVVGTVVNGTPGQMVQLAVNGAPQATVAVGGDGSFAGSVTLTNTLNINDLSLSNPGVAILSPGPVSSPVTLSSGKTSAEVTNVITASLVGAAAGSDSVTVYHAVEVSEFVVNWLSCPPLNKDEGLNAVLGPFQALQVGTVDCGVNPGNTFCATCQVQAGVSTSVGALATTATWLFKVGNCP